MKRKRIFKFLILLLLVASTIFVASCSSDDEESAIIDANGKCISGTIYLVNGERESQYVFIDVLNYPEGDDKYRRINVVVVPKDEFPLSHYQSGDIISFSIVEVKFSYLDFTDGLHSQTPYVCSVKLCK